ncbi:MAG: amino acid adenylation domain-containing protein, partial [bacterium]|nr:amino acid adenylation domain-containing protein [bacterium]
AYIIYTSGTTGKPKGVLTTHYNATRVVLNTSYIRFTQDDRVLQLSNYAFDGSVFDMYGALLNGAVLALIPGQSVAEVDRLAHVIERESITVFFVTTALFNLLVDEQPRIFRHIRKVLFGGERVSVDHTRRALEHSGPNKILHVYGPTETTVYATFYPVNHVDENVVTIPIGQPLSNTTVYVLDHLHRPVPIGVTGEVYIGGNGVAKGYLNRPELTNEKFEVRSAKFALYRTGDLARWLPDGNVEFSGRVDHQVKIRGYRVEMGEIENHLRNLDPIKEAIVIDRQDYTGSRYLTAYIVLTDNGSGTAAVEPDIADFKRRLSAFLPDYMIPPYFFPLDKIPLNPNGKVDRKKLPPPSFQAGDSDAPTPPRTTLERKLLEIWKDVLFGREVSQPSIGIDDNFFKVGGHSLKATALTSKIHREMDVKVPLSKVFKSPTIRGIAAQLTKLGKDTFTALEPVEEKEYYPLSSAQKRLYVIQQLDLESTGYNIPVVLTLENNIPAKKLEEIFNRLLKRHESLRTSFQKTGEQVVQRVHDDVEFAIRYYDLAANRANKRQWEGRGESCVRPGPESTVESFVRPFDLSHAPLLRAGIIQTGDKDSGDIFMLDMHHIISDGASMDIFIKEFKDLHEGNPLPDVKFQYKEFSHWQNRLLESGEVKTQEDYWMKKLSGELPRLELLTDYIRPGVFTFAGDCYDFQLGPDNARRFKTLGVGKGATLYMNFVAVLNTLFYKYTGQIDIITGSVIAGRRHADLHGIIGMFVNTLPLRNHPDDDKTYLSFLEDVATNSIEAFENQDVQLETLVEKLDLERNPSRNPLSDISIVVQNSIHAGKPEPLPDDDSSNRSSSRTSKMDMTFFVMERGEDIVVNIVYYTGIFKEETIKRLASHIQHIIKEVIQEPGLALKDIEIIDETERKKILDQFNDSHRDYPKSHTIHQLLEEQAKKTPDHYAVIGTRGTGSPVSEQPVRVTYRELDQQSNRAASLLKQEGVIPGSIVAIETGHNIEMITGIIGILKAGGAFLPIDPETPGERKDFMLRDSGAGSFYSPLEMGTLPPAGGGVSNQGKSPGDLAYIIYTSGTSGKPKGVMLNHQSLVNYVTWFGRKARLDSKDKTMLTSSAAFDLGYTSIFPSLSKGAELHILSKDIYLSDELLLNYINQHEITYIKVTPSLLTIIVNSHFFIPDSCRSLRLAAVGGEAINLKDIETLNRTCPQVEVMNHYGPTEATIGSVARFVDFRRFDDYRHCPTIGRPISNAKVFILDKHMRLSAIGVAGELCLSGDCLARGYLNRPKLTAERFLNFSHGRTRINTDDHKETNESILGRGESRVRPAREHETVYKTGDLARWLEDGRIQFLGRIDFQVKVRGFRVELAEIEIQLVKHDLIAEAVVIDREDKSGGTYLCAYLKPGDRRTPLPGNRELKQFLARTLPEYMIPSYFIQVYSIPLTPNGKVNRKALPEPDLKANDDYIAPRNPIEKKLAKIWAKVLAIDKGIIGIDDHFFRIGGQSLRATFLSAIFFNDTEATET